MNAGNAIPVENRVWKGLYKAALFELDEAKLPERIAQAEKALAMRARDLFDMAGDNIEEGQALEDAMYALRALRNNPQTHGPVVYHGAVA
jgi:hypothetical protein